LLFIYENKVFLEKLKNHSNTFSAEKLSKWLSLISPYLVITLRLTSPTLPAAPQTHRCYTGWPHVVINCSCFHFYWVLNLLKSKSFFITGPCALHLFLCWCSVLMFLSFMLLSCILLKGDLGWLERRLQIKCIIVIIKCSLILCVCMGEGWGTDSRAVNSGPCWYSGVYSSSVCR